MLFTRNVISGIIGCKKVNAISVWINSCASPSSEHNWMDQLAIILIVRTRDMHGGRRKRTGIWPSVFYLIQIARMLWYNINTLMEDQKVYSILSSNWFLQRLAQWSKKIWPEVEIWVLHRSARKWRKLLFDRYASTEPWPREEFINFSQLVEVEEWTNRLVSKVMYCNL